jgi:hypothetical protein
MFKSWQVFKNSIPIYICSSEKSSFMQKDNIMIAKSGVNNYACNFAIIENSDPLIQKKIIKEHFKCNGLIFSMQENKNAIDSWAEELGFEYYGRVPLMNKRQEPVDVSPKYYDNIRVERVLDSATLKHFLHVFAENRGITVEEASIMFPESVFNPIYFLYVAYYLNEPAGIFVAINTKDGAIVADADVKENLRNSNVLKVLSERAFIDVVSNNIYDYSVLPTSQFAYNVVMQYGFSKEISCDLWQRMSGGVVNG